MAKDKVIARSRIRRTIVNFTEKYGEDGLRRLIMMLSSGTPLREIGKSFGVSGERVGQWRDVFGRSETIMKFTVNPLLSGYGPSHDEEEQDSGPLMLEDMEKE